TPRCCIDESRYVRPSSTGCSVFPCAHPTKFRVLHFILEPAKSLLIVFGEFIDAEDFEDDDVEVEQGEDDVEYDESEPTFDLEKEAADARAFLEQIHPAWPGWTLRWDQRGADAFSDHLRARSLTTIATPAPSHPDDCLLIELAPGAA
ncbi:MAG: hypothetical protein ACK4KV_24290, partial [Rhodocyclaceae bacterium]